MKIRSTFILFIIYSILLSNEIISIDGQQFDEYDKDNYSTLIGAYKNRLGL